MAKAKFSRNAKVIPKRAKIHPVMKQAHDAWARMHGHKFGANVGRGFAKKK